MVKRLPENRSLTAARESVFPRFATLHSEKEIRCCVYFRFRGFFDYTYLDISTSGDFNLHLKGTNTITTPTTENTTISGIEVNNGSGKLTVTGETDGKLLVKCEGFKNTSSGNVYSFHVSDLTINSGAVEVSMKPADGHNRDVWGLYSTVYLNGGSLKVDVDGTANTTAINYTGTRSPVMIEGGAPTLDVSVNAPNITSTDKYIKGAYPSVGHTAESAAKINVSVTGTSISDQNYAVNVNTLKLANGGYLNFNGGKLTSNGLQTSDYTALTEPADVNGVYKFENGVLCKNDGTAITSGKFVGQATKVPIKFIGGTEVDGVVTYTLPELKVDVPAATWKGFIYLLDYVAGCSSPKFEITEGTLPAGLTLNQNSGSIGQSDQTPTTTTAEGSVTIKVSDYYDNTRTPATCKVKWDAITRVNPVQSITLSQTTVPLNIGETENVDATVNPTDASYANLKVESNNASVATASVGTPNDSGKSEVTINAIGPGSATITVTSLDNDISRYITVNVNEATPEAGVSYDKTELTGLTGNAKYIISVDGHSTEYAIPADSGRMAILEAWYGKTISIVKRGATSVLNSAPQTLSINERPAAPNATIDYSAKTITLPAGTYTINGAPIQVPALISIDASWFGSTVKIMKPGKDGGINSATQDLNIPAIPAAPNGLTATPAYNGTNGAIVSGTTQMEYRLKNSTGWTEIHSATTTVPAGTYEVRFKATDTAFASEICEIIIAAETRKHDAPNTSTFTITNATSPTASDGRIDGVLEETHEYRLKDTTEWKQVTGSSVSVLPGTYEIRVKASDTHYASDAIEVVVGYNNTSGGGGSGSGSGGGFSGGSGGGGGGVASYSITASKTENGSVAISPKSASKGKEVTITTTANEGYKLDKLTVLDKDNKEVELTEKDGKYTFKMPASKVTVNASFVKEETEPTTPTEPTEPTTPVTGEWKNLFGDVKESDWYYEAVKYVNENKLMNGTNTNTFSPDETLTRAMLVTILYRLENEPAVNKSIPFGDIKTDMYYANAVIWAHQNGIVNGVSETAFAPDNNISREQIAAIIYRYAVYKGMEAVTTAENLGFADSKDISEYAISAMNWAVDKGLIKGKSATTVNPLDNATRAEIATILQRFIEGNK